MKGFTSLNGVQFGKFASQREMENAFVHQGIVEAIYHAYGEVQGEDNDLAANFEAYHPFMDDVPPPSVKSLLPPEDERLDEAVSEGDTECAVCLENKPNVCLVPCGHVMTCVKCTNGLEHKTCPGCRALIESAVRIKKI